MRKYRLTLTEFDDNHTPRSVAVIIPEFELKAANIRLDRLLLDKLWRKLGVSVEEVASNSIDYTRAA